MTNNYNLKSKILNNINGLNIHILENNAEIKKDNIILLLHGFPEISFSYRYLMVLFEKAGYYCIAPDQRGYSKGARPKSKNDYKIEYLVEDIFLLADEFSFKEFHLVGHDWGAAVGWVAVNFYPERIISWSALSVPHIDALNQAREIDKNQQKKSRYLKFFNLPFHSAVLQNILLSRLWLEDNIESEGFECSFGLINLEI